jgi:hypothetical protein
MIEEIGVQKIIYGITSYVYKIQVRQSFVFMRIDRKNYENDKRYVEFVELFLFHVISFSNNFR